VTEDDAQRWIMSRFGEAAHAGLAHYKDLLVDEATRQNVVAPSTIPSIWQRHLVDSAQLLLHVPDPGYWVDVGSGPGLPGIVVSALSDHHVAMVEPRKLRADFLKRCVDELGLSAEVYQCSIERWKPTRPVDTVSARAVASLSKLLAMTDGWRSPKTRFVLPKGKSAETEVAEAQQSWQGAFHVERSIVDPQSGIVIASGVRKR
jgi:16S rRNA (guanine527-N7)-methyltransferase